MGNCTAIFCCASGKNRTGKEFNTEKLNKFLEQSDKDPVGAFCELAELTEEQTQMVRDLKELSDDPVKGVKKTLTTE